MEFKPDGGERMGMGSSARASRRALFSAGVVLAVATAPLAPTGIAAQGVTSRSPNLSGGWVAPSGAARFHFTHRFRTVDSGDETWIRAAPTFLLGVPVTDRILVGAHLATSSFLSAGKGNEIELFGRWALPAVSGPLNLAITGAYNRAAESADGEISIRFPVSLPESFFLDGIDVLGAARGFSDALASGEPGWYFGGGVLLHRGNLALAGDFGTLASEGLDEEAAWGVGLQIQIPTTPHTLSIHASNTRTTTLQGSSVGTGTNPGPSGPRRTFWGFEFTVPLTYGRLFG